MLSNELIKQQGEEPFLIELVETRLKLLEIRRKFLEYQKTYSNSSFTKKANLKATHEE